MDDKTINNLRRELKIHAHALDIPEGAAESFIDATLKSVQKSLSKKSVITKADLSRFVTKELKKYHADLAYVYNNCDTII